MSYRKHLIPSDMSPSVAYAATVVDSNTDTISKAKLISESAFYEAIYKLPIRGEKADGENYYYLVSIADIFKMLEQLPSAQPTEPERQRGAWIEYIPEHGKCPFCGNKVDLLDGSHHYFCEECGAEMEVTT